MARLREFPYVIRRVGPFTFIKRLIREINDDGVLNMAAAIAFYWLLALFPLVIFLMSLAAVMPAGVRDATGEKVKVWIYSNLASQAADTVWENAKPLLDQPRGALLSFGLIATLWAASNGVNATMGALDRCYDITKPRPFIKQRAVAICITFSFVLIVLLIVVLLPVTSVILRYFEHSTGYAPSWAQGGTKMAINITRYSLGVMLVILLVSSVYQFGVSLRRRWTLFTPGAVFAVFGVMGMAYGFNLYLQWFGAESYNRTYGALGGIIILQLLFFLYAVVFLIGAEINSEIDYEILGAKNDEGTDPLPHLHHAKELERFKSQLELRRSKRNGNQ